MIHTLHIGINDYVGTENDLAGCVNDARAMANLFKGADSQSMLLDKQASVAAIRRSMKQALALGTDGDWVVITYSGHGSYVADKDHDELDGHDECLVGADLNLLVDDEIFSILSDRPAGVRVLFVTDSCHSGTVLRLFRPAGSKHRVRFLPPAHFPLGKRPRAALRTRPPQQKVAIPGIVHFAACLDPEFSYDTEFNGQPSGAFTHYLIEARVDAGLHATLGQWFAGVKKYLPSSDYVQHPVANAPMSMLELPADLSR